MNRRIDTLIIHCSATKAGQDFSAADIDRWHRESGYDGIGYHYVVRLDGTIEKGRDVALPGAHCRGWNARSIGICYIGGLDANGQPADTRTKAQKRVLYQLILELQRTYPTINLVLGHRDTSPDRNGNGIIESFEYIKACPCFDVKEFLRIGRAMLFALLVALVFSCLLSSCKSSRSLRHEYIESDSVAMSARKVSSESSAQAFHTVWGEGEERIEQTVLVFGEDTIRGSLSKRHPSLASVVRTVVDKRYNTGSCAVEMLHTVAKDSVQELRRKHFTKEAILPKKGWGGWALLGVGMALAVIVLRRIR